MRRFALISAAIALVVPAATASGGDAAKATKPCTANAEVGPKGKIAFGFSCRKGPVNGIAIDAMSGVRKVKPTLRVDPRGSAGKAPECRVKLSDAICKGNVDSDAVITGWLTVAGDPCDASVTFYITANGIRTIIPTGVPQFC